MFCRVTSGETLKDEIYLHLTTRAHAQDGRHAYPAVIWSIACSCPQKLRLLKLIGLHGTIPA